MRAVVDGKRSRKGIFELTRRTQSSEPAEEMKRSAGGEEKGAVVTARVSTLDVDLMKEASKIHRSSSRACGLHEWPRTRQVLILEVPPLVSPQSSFLPQRLDWGGSVSFLY